MTEAANQPADEQRRPNGPTIIGVGASAGAPDSIERFFSRLTLEADQALVLALRHRDAFDGTVLNRMLKAQSGLRLAEPSDGDIIEPGTVYLCARSMITTIAGDRFAVREVDHGSGDRATIDSFLVSLAEERGEQSIGVMLAGTGGDGTLGVATVKDHGGLAIAGKTERADLLAESGTPAAIADSALPAEDIPEHIQIYARHLRRL